MSDSDLRALERAVATGDGRAAARLEVARVRHGLQEISLAGWHQELRPYQRAALDRARAAVAERRNVLLTCPTGTGKGTAQLALLQELRRDGVDAWIVTPSLEVLRGYLERCGATPAQLEVSEARLAALGELIYATTPVRLRNRLKTVKLAPPAVLVLDEAHHAVGRTVAGGGLAELCPGAVRIGWTATGFRGTPEETMALREAWGEPVEVLSIPQALACGAWAEPTWRVEAVLDDDDVAVVRGELDADEATVESVEPLADLVARLDLAVPTCVTVSCVAAAEALAAALALAPRGCAPQVVVGDTPAVERAVAYAAVRDQFPARSVLVSVRVLGEGVDLPWLRRLVDARPTLSPVAWLQQVGRITRPGPVRPEYVGTNRNLERHGYLLQGALPRAALRRAQEAFGGASRRGARAGLFKGVGRAAPRRVPLAGGVDATMWALSLPGPTTREVVLVLDPTADRVFCAAREVNALASGRDRWGPWTAAEPPLAPERGLKPPRWGDRPLSEAQRRWWQRDARRVGLDPERAGEVTAATFWALPALLACRETMTAKSTSSAVGAGDHTIPHLSPPAPAAPSGPGEVRRATWARLRSGDWGGRVLGPEPEPGTELLVRSQAGREERRVVTRVLWRDEREGVSLCQLEEPREAPRGPRSPAELWAVGALTRLAADDPDRAAELNQVGFSKFDGEIGHDYARRAGREGLTDREWRHALSVLRRYHRQVGGAPAEEEKA